jgi:hypothetical protein
MTQPDLEDCQSVLEDGEEDQWRQVHPNFLDGDVVAREAFVGTPGATDEISTARAAVVSAAEACRHHRQTLKLETTGSWPVSVDAANSAGARVIDDSQCEGIATPGHSLIDMRGMTKSDRRKARTELAAHTTARGPSFT